MMRDDQRSRARRACSNLLAFSISSSWPYFSWYMSACSTHCRGSGPLGVSLSSSHLTRFCRLWGYSAGAPYRPDDTEAPLAGHDEAPVSNAQAPSRGKGLLPAEEVGPIAGYYEEAAPRR